MRTPRLAPAIVFAFALLLGFIAPALGVQSAHDQVPSAVPGASTPAINNGSVSAIAKVGNTIVVSGDFSSVTPNGGSALTRNYIVAFDANTGAVSNTFRPVFNNRVNDVVAGPNGTVYVGGSFSSLNGSSVPRVVRLNVSDGSQVTGFRAGSMNGAVNTLALRANRLFVGGNFTQVAGAANGGLTTLNATSGARDTFMNIQVTERHNNSGSGAQGAIGVRALDVNPAGTKMVIIGNFRKVDGLDRVQAAMIDLGATATVDPDWRTSRYEPLCFNWAFDTYVRGVQMSPDGSYFVIASTGGPVGGTLCDTAARWETDATGSDVQPTWVDYSGGDTLYSVAVTGTAVYVGGHQRWMNNPDAGDSAGAGAVPRPGLVALDPANGIPLKWNPGRNPRGAGAEALLATPDGLWVGSDTEWIGTFDHRRPRIAFFPLDGGAAPQAPDTGALPGNVYLASNPGSTGPANVLYRVNAGGPALQSIDSGPDWAADDNPVDPHHNDGNNAATYSPVPSVSSTVPASTPSSIFDSERWDPGDAPAMSWSFPVPDGVPLQVRLYFANRYTGTGQVGGRIFDVSLEGSERLSDYDIVADTGDQQGTMKAFDITSDGSVDISFGHHTENPLVNGIEIVRTDIAPPPPADANSLVYRTFTGTTSSADQATASGGIEWAQSRGAFMVGDQLFYGSADGRLYQRAYNGSTFGSATMLDPYHDPEWANVDTGSGQTYNGAFPGFYSELSNVTGMFFADGRIYYTLFGSNRLYYRGFSPDSGIVGQTRFEASNGIDWTDTRGMFINGSDLYVGSASSGNLRRFTFSDGQPSGTAAVVSGPGVDNRSWKSRTMFLLPGEAPPPNQPPTARFTSGCLQLSCSFDGSTSSDPDGTLSFSWDFGDGASSTQESPSHDFANEGNYPVTLTVTDDDGARDSVTHDVQVAEDTIQEPVTFAGANHGNANSATVSTTVPAAAAAGDTLLLFLSSGNTVTPSGPSGVTGWTQLDTLTNSTMTTTVWWKPAAADDGGKSVNVGLGKTTKSNLVVAVYKGTDAATPVAGVATVGDSATASHTTPTLPVTSGQYAVSFWADKSSSTNAWAAPPEVTVRDTSLGSGTGRYTSLLADSGGPVPSGSYGGLTATTDAASGKATMWTIALTPGGS